MNRIRHSTVPIIPDKSARVYRNVGTPSLRSQPSAMTTAPAVMSRPPIRAGAVSFSPSSSQAKTMTSGTLSLSSGATREAGPSCRARPLAVGGLAPSTGSGQAVQADSACALWGSWFPTLRNRSTTSRSFDSLRFAQDDRDTQRPGWGSLFPTLAAKTKTRQGWGTRLWAPTKFFTGLFDPRGWNG